MSSKHGAALVLTCHRPDRPDGGAALRNCQNINALSRLGPVDVVSIGVEESSSTIPGVRHWQTFSWKQLLDGQSVGELARRRLWPLRPGIHPAIDFYRQGRVTEWLRNRLAECSYELGVVEELFLAGYAPLLKAAGCRLIYDAHNVEATLHADLDEACAADRQGIRERLRDRLRRKRIRAEEERIVTSSDLVWTCSEADRAGIGEVYGRREGVSVVPNGVEVASYKRDDAFGAGSDWSHSPVTVVFVGAYAYYPNEEAARFLIDEIFPRLRARREEARLVLVGRHPSAEMMEASRSDERIEVTGGVADVLPYLSQPCIVVTPLRIGGGTRLKILEAFAAGRPVVSSPKGAEGIAAENGEHLFLREEPDEFVEAVVNLWENRELRGAMVANALDLVRREYSWEAAAERIELSLGRSPADAGGSGAGVLVGPAV